MRRFPALLLRYAAVPAAAAALAYTSAMGLSAAEPSAKPSQRDYVAELGKALSSLRQRMFGNYENRIREMSSPEKVFQYFASVQKGDERFMTAADFVRSITPYNFSADAVVGLSDQVSQTQTLPSSVARVMAVADSSGDGLISFEEYVFFTTLLSIPTKYFEIAFRVMDVNNDGKVDAEEFRKVMSVIQSRNPVAQASRTTAMDSGVLLPGWFGADGKKTLSYKQFSTFLLDLHTAVTDLYFSSLDRDGDGYVSARDFAMALVNFTSAKELPSFAQRVAKLEHSDTKVSLQDLRDWQIVLQRIDELDEALSVYVAGSGREFTLQQLKRAARAVTGVTLRDEHLAVVLVAFDEDGNGLLSRAEFIDTLRRARGWGLAKPRDFGLTRFVSCVYGCARNKHD